MSVSLPNGATVSISTGFGASKTLSAFTNANPGVATLEASHGIAVGGIFVATSGWSRANGNVYRASAVATNDVTVEGLNTSSTTLFPAGSGAGSVKEVSGWQQITQILEVSSTGGEQQFVNYSFLEEDAEHQIPTVKSPRGYTFSIGDDATLAHYAYLAAADADRQPRAIRIILPSGSPIYFYAYVTLNKTPSLTKNEIMALQVTMSAVNETTRYTS